MKTIPWSCWEWNEGERITVFFHVIRMKTKWIIFLHKEKEYIKSSLISIYQRILPHFRISVYTSNTDSHNYSYTMIYIIFNWVTIYKLTFWNTVPSYTGIFIENTINIINRRRYPQWLLDTALSVLKFREIITSEIYYIVGWGIKQEIMIETCRLREEED